MADDARLVELLKFYKKKTTVTRPEVGVLTGKTVGAIAGICNRADITGWPKIDPDSMIDRPCQFPILKNGERQVCGLFRSVDVDADPLRCSDHREHIWDPEKEL